MEIGVSYNKQRLQKGGYFRELTGKMSFDTINRDRGLASTAFGTLVGCGEELNWS